MTGPRIDDIEQMLCTQKMSDSGHTAVAQCIYICNVNTGCPCCPCRTLSSEVLQSACKQLLICGCTSICQASTSADPKKNVLTMNACMQNQKQQLKSWEQNSPSHMQMVQQQQPFSLQGDPDTKMPQITGFDHDRQQLATAMAGACHDDSCLTIPGL